MSKTLRQRWRYWSGVFFFNAGASFYAWMTWQPTWRAHCASLADYFPAAERPAVLDVGIGPGVSGIGILDRRPDAWVVGVDFASAMLSQARRYLRRADRQFDLVRGDVMSLPFADASFDVVTHHSFLYLLSDRDQALAELRRVLRPGGSYVILEPHRDGKLGDILMSGGGFRFTLSMVLWRIFSRGYGQFGAAELAALLTSHGFVEVQVETTLSGLGLLARARNG